jgi:ABC-2 type transport system permease protein
MVDAAQPAVLAPMRWNGPAKVIRDTWLVFQRQMLLLFRLPVRIVLTFVYPVTYLLIYAPMLKGALSSQGVTDYTEAYRVYVPGLLAFTATLGGLSTGFILLADIRSGVLERGATGQPDVDPARPGAARGRVATAAGRDHHGPRAALWTAGRGR